MDILELGGEDPNVKGSDGIPVAHKCAQEGYCGYYIKRLVELGADINFVSPIGTVAWLATKSEPCLLPELQTYGCKSLPGSLSYTGDLYSNINVAIAYQDDKSFDDLLSEYSPDLETLPKLYNQCIRFGYVYGFDKLEKSYSNNKPSMATEIIDDDFSKQYYGKQCAFNYCWINHSGKRVFLDFVEISKRLIRNLSSPPSTELVSSLVITPYLWKHSDEFIQLLDLLLAKNGDLSEIKLSNSRLDLAKKNYGVSAPICEYLSELMDRSVDISIVVPQLKKFREGEKTIIKRAIKLGQYPSGLKEVISKGYNSNRDGLLAFLLECKITSASNANTLWSELFESKFVRLGEPLKPKYELSSSFIQALIDNGLDVDRVIVINDSFFLTPLLLAQRINSEELVDLLINNGASEEKSVTAINEFIERRRSESHLK
jgi:hypothetical protein